ncbi:MAG: peptidoglycan glycosyltransferase [Glaciecola sp.]
MAPNTAALLREMMVEVVTNGTGTRAAIIDVTVGGKTGTAEVPEQTPTVWFTGFARDGDRRIAVAVVLPDAGIGATGGAMAAPIAKAMMEAFLDLR